MKRYFFLAVIMALIFVLSGCNSVESSENNKSSEPVASAVDDTNNENKEPQKDSVKDAVTANELQISWFDNPPHIFIDEQSGKLTGAVYDLLEQKIAPKMNVKFVWDMKASAIPRQTTSFEANDKPFASALLTKNPDREKISICTNKTFFNKKIDDILNLKVGYAEKAFISPFMKDPRVKFDLVSASNYHQTNLKKLTSGRLDAVYAPDKAAFLKLIKEMNLENDVKILDLPENKAAFYVVFSKAASSIADKYNEVSNGMDLEKEYLDLLAKYIDTSKL